MFDTTELLGAYVFYIFGWIFISLYVNYLKAVFTSVPVLALTK